MGRHFPVGEKSGNFQQAAQVRENHTKYWESQGISEKCYLLFLVIFKWTVYYLLKWIKLKKTLKKYWKMGTNMGKMREFCQSGKWESC